MAKRMASSSKTYGIENWGAGYVKVNRRGHVEVDVNCGLGPTVDIFNVVQELVGKGIQPPLILRFPQIITHRLDMLHECFRKAIEEWGYENRYQGVFPMKVNHRREVIETLLDTGRKYNFGLEVGSKPELFVALGLPLAKDQLLVCNGFKDSTYLTMAINAAKLDRNVVVILESVEEAAKFAKLIKRVEGKQPSLGIRARLYSKGSGRWEESGGDQSKFGLSSAEVLEVIDILRHEDLLDILRMLHFHIGSQITEIKRVKNAIKEAGRLFSKLKNMVPSLKYLNVGGGLGVDYDGSKTSSDSSINYTVQEYANDVIYTLKEVCVQENIPMPIVVSESGRSLAAYHSILAISVHRGIKPMPEMEKVPLHDDDPEVVIELGEILRDMTQKNYREFYHDALERREEMFTLFNLGHLDLYDRAKGEAFFFEICRTAVKFAHRDKGHVKEEFLDLESNMAGRMICNFSVFQSVPDAWAIEQLFPIMPIHRLTENPVAGALIADITCDSDGIIDRFVDIKREKEFLEVHPTDNKTPYYLGLFLTGAYQDIIGDFHNLYGRCHEAIILLDDEGLYHYQKIIKGDTVRDAISSVRYDPDAIIARFEQELNNRAKNGDLTQKETKAMSEFFKAGMEGTTYLYEPLENKKGRRR